MSEKIMSDGVASLLEEMADRVLYGLEPWGRLGEPGDLATDGELLAWSDGYRSGFAARGPQSPAMVYGQTDPERTALLAAMAYDACREAAYYTLDRLHSAAERAAADDADDGQFPASVPTAEESRAEWQAGAEAVRAHYRWIAETADALAVVTAQHGWPECIGLAVNAAQRTWTHHRAQTEGGADAFGMDPSDRMRSWEGQYDGSA